MIEIINKANCCGCSACSEICHKNAISMVADEQGFLYPKVDVTKCVKCGRCINICPIINQNVEKTFDQTAYLLQHKDKNILLDSTSGGAFSAIAELILKMNGVVLGAAYDSNFSVKHCYVDKVEDLKKFRNSKYVQSKIEHSYRDVKRFLACNRIVLFSGTPCQIEGLLNYIGKDNALLYTIDVVCHAVPSPAVWEAYLSNFKDKQISNIRFRDKAKYGYLYSQFKIDFNNTSLYEGIEKNQMLRAFFSEICNRPSCYCCKFKKRYRRSDFTVWDCFDLKKFSNTKVLSQDLGISRVIIHSSKGKALFEKVKNNCLSEQISVETALHFDAKEFFESVKKNDKYEEFWKDFALNNQYALKKYFSMSFMILLESSIRKIAYKIGIFDIIRKGYKFLLGNRKR